MFKRDSKKSPGKDGIVLDFFKILWGEIANDMRTLSTQMLRGRKLSEKQKQGAIVCIPICEKPKTPKDYRPITLLNTDYKIIARLLAARMRSVVPELLHPSQHCGVPENTIFDAVAAIRDAIAYVEKIHRPLCVVSLDLKEAFDRISHKYIWTILCSYGFREEFVVRIAMMYNNATSSVQTNGHISTPIQIRCGVRQGCPLSMTSFALCLNPLLYYLDKRLNGISTSWRQKRQK